MRRRRGCASWAWQPDGAIWYCHACCSAGSEAPSAFESLFAETTEVGRVLRSVASLGARVARRQVTPGSHRAVESVRTAILSVADGCSTSRSCATTRASADVRTWLEAQAASTAVARAIVCSLIVFLAVLTVTECMTPSTDPASSRRLGRQTQRDSQLVLLATGAFGNHLRRPLALGLGMAPSGRDTPSHFDPKL